MKLHNTRLIQKGNKLFVEYYKSEKPKAEHYSERGRFDDIAYEFDLNNWEASKQLVEVPQEKAFKKFTYNIWFRGDGNFGYDITSKVFENQLEQGISISDENIEIGCYAHRVENCNSRLCGTNYAFLRESTKIADFIDGSEYEKWEVPDKSDRELIEMIHPNKVVVPSDTLYSERQLEMMYCIGYLNQKDLSMDLLSEQANELKHKFSLAKDFVKENIPFLRESPINK